MCRYLCVTVLGCALAKTFATTAGLPDKVMPEDIARMVLFLASDDARACTAQEFVVDAGWS